MGAGGRSPSQPRRRVRGRALGEVRLRRAGRWVGIALSFALAFAVVPTAVFGMLDRAGIEPPTLGLDLVPALSKRLRKFDANRDTAIHRVAFLGDSTALGEPPRRAVPAQLERAANELARGDSKTQVVSLAFPGLGPVDYYWLADLVSEAAPNRVVLVFNAATLSRTWARRLTRPELAGWVRPGRLPEALLMPLDWIDVRADEILLHAAVVQAGGAESWHRVRRQQIRVAEGRRSLERALDSGGSDGGGAMARYERLRFDAQVAQLEEIGTEHSGLRGRYGAALDGLPPDHPILEILSATVRTFRKYGVTPIVYFAPINVEALAAVGLRDDEGLARTMSALRHAVEPAGGVFVDLHALLPSEAFRDPQGHYASSGEIDGPARIAAALAPLVTDRARDTHVLRR